MIARRIIAMLFALLILPAIVVALPSEPTLIPVLLADFKFVPSIVRLQPHKTYVLRLTNSGFPMRCTYFGHALMGMTGHLEVNAFATTPTHCVERPANPTLGGQGRRSPCLGDRGARGERTSNKMGS